jgi:cation diffusion facilitator CzcD-associated flavoprotein CzcO
MAQGIDRRFWAHSAEDIDFAALRGRVVGVVGAGASAMDNAATALEAGAAGVDMFIRRPALPRINKLTGIGSPGLVNGFQALPDAAKWRFLDYALREQTPPPRDSTLRVSTQGGRFHVGSPVLRLEQDGEALAVTTPKGVYRVDFMIFATGFRLDAGQRPEFSAFLPHVRLWGDRFTPPPGEENAELAHLPDLGPAFEFQEKQPGACPMLARIHCFNDHATLSQGKVAGDIPAVSDGARRLARGLAGLLFAEDEAAHFAALQAFDTPELLGDEWRDADALPALSAA